MAKTRKDPKGNVLRKYEIYRKKNKLYEYRHPSADSIYAKTLSELREKEEEIIDQVNRGMDYKKGRFTFKSLVEKYLQYNKRTIREQTDDWYKNLLKKRINDEIFSKQIAEIKTSDMKDYFIQLDESKYAYETLTKLHSLFKRAFNMAVEDDAIVKNPCEFVLSECIVKKPKKEKFSLTVEQQQAFLNFIKQDKVYGSYYEHYLILLGTGLRISELCGLTEKDIDWENRLIRVDHQLLFAKGQYKIDRPKTQKGIRTIPMTDEVYWAFKRVLNNRPKPVTEMLIDGYSKFLFIRQDGKPETKNSMGGRTKRIINKYNKCHEKPLPQIRTHILRHTYASNMANSGMNSSILKSLMGHSKVQVTLDVYTHSNTEDIVKEMQRINLIG